MIRKNNKGWKVLIHRSESIAHPATHSGKARHLESGGLEIGGLTVNSRFADEVVDKSDIINHSPQIRNGFAQLLPRLSIGFERPHRLHPGPKAILKCFDVLSEIRGLGVMANQLRFVIEEIDVTRRPSHEELNHSLCFRWTMRCMGETLRRRASAQQSLRCE